MTEEYGAQASKGKAWRLPLCNPYVCTPGASAPVATTYSA